MFFARDREEFLAYGTARDDGFATEALGGFSMGDGDARGHVCEDAIRETRLDVRLENYTWDRVNHGEKHHWTRGVTSHAESCSEFVSAKNSCRVDQPCGEHRRVAKQLCAADAFQAGDANRFKRQSRLRYQLCFHPALGSYYHDASISL